MFVQVVDGPIDEVATRAHVQRPENGAVLMFHGVVRNHHEGKAVERIDYHGYRAMVLRELRTLCDEITRGRDEPIHLAVVHRLGVVQVGEASLLVAVGSPHRRPAFEVGLELIDELKRRVPVWKKEYGPDGDHWVEGVMPGPSLPAEVSSPPGGDS